MPQNFRPKDAADPVVLEAGIPPGKEPSVVPITLGGDSNLKDLAKVSLRLDMSFLPPHSFSESFNL